MIVHLGKKKVLGLSPGPSHYGQCSVITYMYGVQN